MATLNPTHVCRKASHPFPRSPPLAQNTSTLLRQPTKCPKSSSPYLQGGRNSNKAVQQLPVSSCLKRKPVLDGSNPTNSKASKQTSLADDPILPNLLDSKKKSRKPCYRFYYYVSQVQKDIQDKDEQAQGIFLCHIISCMCVRRSHQLTSFPSPQLTLKQSEISNKKIQKPADRKILIFDLDETLVHSLSMDELEERPGVYFQNQYKVRINKKCRAPHRNVGSSGYCRDEKMATQHWQEGLLAKSMASLEPKAQKDDYLRQTRDTQISLVVNVRPHAKQVLRRLSQYFTLAIFTASTENYASQVIRVLDPKQELFSFQLYRQHCTEIRTEGNTAAPLLIKDLRILENFDPSKTVLIDNSFACYLLQPDNGIPIIPFIDDSMDDQLLKLESFLLNSILPCKDVRSVVRQYFRSYDYANFTTVRDLLDKIKRGLLLFPD